MRRNHVLVHLYEGLQTPQRTYEPLKKIPIVCRAERQNRTTLEFVTPRRSLRRNKHTQSIQNYTH